MNCKQANTHINIRDVLESFSLFPSKENHQSAFYFAFDREEKTPSLSVNFVKNTAFDFGTGKKYDVVSLVQGIKQCSISEALEYLSQFDFSFQKQIYDGNKAGSRYEILSISEVRHRALVQYLRERRIDDNAHLIREIHYKVSDKKYFGIGFENDSGGYEIRNKYSKICLGNKDITTANEGSEILLLFEGFTDYLSYLNNKNLMEIQTVDAVVLNSVSLVFKVEKILGKYQKIIAFFDNDKAGDKAFETLKTFDSRVEDARVLYKDYKDLNEFVVAKMEN